jgi:hypothetical protein
MVRAVPPCPSLRPRLIAAAVLLLAALGAGTAAGHTRSLSYSSWHPTEEGARVSVRIPLLELSRLGIPLPTPTRPFPPGAVDPVALYLAAHLHLRVADTRCEPVDTPQSRPTTEGWLMYRWQVACPVSGERTIETDILLAQAPSHLHFARVSFAATGATGATGETDERIIERVLTDQERRWPLGDAAGETASTAISGDAVGSTLGAYILLGVEHILTGWDHLLFLFALILLAGRFGVVVQLITGFTVAHSVTLALAVLGVVHTAAAPVEAVIGFSVALTAAENSWSLGDRDRWVPWLAVAGLLWLAGLALAGFGHLGVVTLLGLALFTACHFALLRDTPDATRLRFVLAFAFGLAHGLGFAGVLAEMSLPTERLAPALLGFNVGVELGQLAVLALVWPLLVGLRRAGDGSAHRLVAEVSSAAVCGVGLYWFIIRTFGQA